MEPTKIEWNRCCQYACQLANACYSETENSQKDTAKIRKKILDYLHRLQRKYPESVNVLASLGDVCVNDRLAIKYLEMAYKIAQKNQDSFNLTQIADSLLTISLSKEPIDYEQAHYWAKMLADNLQKSYDEGIDEHLKDALLDLQNFSP